MHNCKLPENGKNFGREVIDAVRMMVASAAGSDAETT